MITDRDNILDPCLGTCFLWFTDGRSSTGRFLPLTYVFVGIPPGSPPFPVLSTTSSVLPVRSPCEAVCVFSSCKNVLLVAVCVCARAVTVVCCVVIVSVRVPLRCVHVVFDRCPTGVCSGVVIISFSFRIYFCEVSFCVSLSLLVCVCRPSVGLSVYKGVSSPCQVKTTRTSNVRPARPQRDSTSSETTPRGDSGPWWTEDICGRE